MLIIRGVGALPTGILNFDAARKQAVPNVPTVTQPQQQGLQTVAKQLQQQTAALGTTCQDACSADPDVAMDAETLARCVSICQGTNGNTAIAIQNSKRGSFCAAAGDQISLQVGEMSGADTQALFDMCVNDPDAFIARTKELGVDLGVEGETPFWKKPGTWILGGGALIVGVLAYRRFR